jgi:hypothetical protein
MTMRLPLHPHAAALATVLALAAAGCAHAPGRGALDAWQRAAPALTDSTTALYRFDEPTGLTLVDAGAAQRNGIYGIDTQVAFGRWRSARQFSGTINSFALVPADRAPSLGPSWTMQVWVRPTAYGPVECNVIAAHWTEQVDEQGWMLGMLGASRVTIPDAPPNPDLFTALLPRREGGLVVFAYQPREAGAPRAFTSTSKLELDRWQQLTLSYDGTTLSLYIDGRLDAQYTDPNGVRDVTAPLVFGNLIDPRWLTDALGATRVPDDGTHYPFYAWVGMLDEFTLTEGVMRPNGR